MSLAIRTLIADAANAVPGIAVQPRFVASTEPGAGMVRLERIEYPNRLGGICHWNVVVMLPQDQETAEAYMDDKLPALVEAVAEQLVVTQVQPQRLDLPTLGILPVVFINGHREQE